jgi:SsrA-binding protein
MAKQSKKQSDSRTIVTNKKARHDYTILETFEAGLMLEGWEVKSLRERRAQLKESYVLLKDGEAWLIGAHFSPTNYASTHLKTDPVRSRKLLLHEKQLFKLFRGKERDGCTVVPLDLHWTRQYAKVTIGLAKGKKKHDKRATSKERDWSREKQRILKKS